MTIVNSGWITMQHLANEFGRAGGIMLISEYYRGKPRVPNVAKNNKIPTSGQVWLSNYYGASSVIPGQWNQRALGWSNFTWPNFEYMDVYVYGAGGGGGGSGGYTIENYRDDTHYKFYNGSNGADGGNSSFPCNGFTMTATGGKGGVGGAGGGGTGASGAHGTGVNGDVNITGHEYVGGGAGSSSSYNSPFDGGTRRITSTGGRGGSGGYAKRSFVRGGYGAHNQGVTVSAHIGTGGSGAQRGANGFIDIYWS